MRSLRKDARGAEAEVLSVTPPHPAARYGESMIELLVRVRRRRPVQTIWIGRVPEGIRVVPGMGVPVVIADGDPAAAEIRWDFVLAPRGRGSIARRRLRTL